MLKIKKSDILIGTIVFLLFRPTILIQYATLDGIASLFVNVISMGALGLWVLKKMPTDRWLRVLGFFSATLVVMTAVNNGSQSLIFATVKLFASSLIIYMLIKRYGKRFFSVTKYTLFFMVIANLISMILFPDGIIQLAREANEWYQYSVSWWIFGNKNSMIMWLYPLNILAQISIHEGEKASSKSAADYIMITCTLLTAFLSQSSTTIIAITLLTLCAFLSRWLPRNISPVVILSFYVLLTILLVTSSQLGIFEFVANIFGKDATFTGRTTAWAQSLVLIFNKPWIGYGILDANTSRNLLGAFAFVNSHNTMLQALIEGGLLLCVQYIVILYILCKETQSPNGKSTKIRQIMQWGIIILCVLISFEAYIDSVLFWNILTTMYYSIKYAKGVGNDAVY